MIKIGLVLSALCLTGVGFLNPAAAQDVDGSAEPRILASQESAKLRLMVGEGRSIITEQPIAEVAVVDPDVLDVVIGAPNRAHLLAKSIGRTDIMLSDEQGRTINRIQARVSADLSALRDTLSGYLGPNAIEVTDAGDAIVLTGTAPSAATSTNAARLARRFVAEDDQIVNMIDVVGRSQVHLRVKVAEVERNVIKNLGVRLGFASEGGQWSYSTSPPPGVGGAPPLLEQISSFVTYNTNLWDGTLTAVLNALEEDGIVRTLAEPNLTALSGETAEMLAGGEFPIPVSQREDTITLEYKQFGVGLAFTPFVLSDGRVSLEVDTEVSAVSTREDFELFGITVPSLSVRRARTRVDLPSGGSIVIAGLLQNDIRNTVQGFPYLMDLPILGSLFKSQAFQQNQSELVIIVTPYLVKESDPALLTTAAPGYIPPNDLEMVVLNRLSAVYAPDVPAPEALAGYFGYIIE